MDRSPLPPRQIILFYACVQDFHSGGLGKLWAPNSLHTGGKDAMSIQIPFKFNNQLRRLTYSN